MQETRVLSLSQEDPREKERTTHSSILAGKSYGQEAWQATVHEVTKESDTTFIYWPNHKAFGILAPQPVIEPVPPCLGSMVLTLNHEGSVSAVLKTH